MAKITISVPDEFAHEAREWANRTGGTVSGFFSELAARHLEADKASRDQLRQINDPARTEDPTGYAERQQSFMERARAAQAAATAKATKYRKGAAA